MSSGYDVIVIGGGSPGQHCASALAADGLRVARVEHELVGGQCGALKALHGQIATERGPGAFGVRAVRADSRANAATSTRIEKGTRSERKIR